METLSNIEQKIIGRALQNEGDRYKNMGCLDSAKIRYELSLRFDNSPFNSETKDRLIEIERLLSL